MISDASGHCPCPLPARPRAKNRAIWLNPLPVTRDSITGQARARPLPVLEIQKPARYLEGNKIITLGYRIL